jgi:branched-subunit amino acid permease
MLASSVVDWKALGEVVLYSLVAGIGVPAVYALAVLGAARSTDSQRERRGAQATAYAVLALLGGVACLGAIAFGIYLMTQKG